MCACVSPAPAHNYAHPRPHPHPPHTAREVPACIGSVSALSARRWCLGGGGADGGQVTKPLVLDPFHLGVGLGGGAGGGWV